MYKLGEFIVCVKDEIQILRLLKIIYIEIIKIIDLKVKILITKIHNNILKTE